MQNFHGPPTKGTWASAITSAIKSEKDDDFGFASDTLDGGAPLDNIVSD